MDTQKNFGKAIAVIHCLAAAVASGAYDMQAAAVEFSKRLYAGRPWVADHIRAGEIPGAGAGAGWGSELTPSPLANALVRAAYAQSALGQMTAHAVHLPMNAATTMQTTAPSFAMVADRYALPAVSAAFSTPGGFNKAVLGGVFLLSKELATGSGGAAILQREAPAQLAHGLDVNAFSGTYSILANQFVAEDSSILDVDGHVDLALNAIRAGNPYAIYGAVGPDVALWMVMQRDATSGARVFPDMSLTGGKAWGVPIVVGTGVPAGTVVFVDASELGLADLSPLEIEFSTSATIEMNSQPTGEAATPTAASQAMVSMFQNEMVAIKIAKPLAFRMLRENRISYVSGIDTSVGVATA